MLEQRWNHTKERGKGQENQNIDLQNLQIHKVQLDTPEVDPIQMPVRRKLITMQLTRLCVSKSKWHTRPVIDSYFHRIKRLEI